LGFWIADFGFESTPAFGDPSFNLGFGIADFGFERQPPRPSATPHSIWDLGFGIWDLGSRIADCGFENGAKVRDLYRILPSAKADGNLKE
jgi:hypothetical protein